MAGSSQMGQAADVMSGIGSALIATALGLGVAIAAVILFNSFQSIVKHYEDDFQLIKLLFLSYADGETPATQSRYTQQATSRVNL